MIELPRLIPLCYQKEQRWRFGGDQPIEHMDVKKLILATSDDKGGTIHPGLLDVQPGMSLPEYHF